jgi:hypothetical protein
MIESEDRWDSSWKNQCRFCGYVVSFDTAPSLSALHWTECRVLNYWGWGILRSRKCGCKNHKDTKRVHQGPTGGGRSHR